MRKKSYINQIKDLLPKVVWPQYNEAFERVKFRLEQLIEENVAYGPDVQLKYCEDDQVFDVKFVQSRSCHGGPSIEIVKVVEVDPRLPLTPQIKALQKIHCEMLDLVIALEQEVDSVVRKQWDLPEKTKLSVKHENLQTETVALTDLQTKLRQEAAKAQEVTV